MGYHATVQAALVTLLEAVLPSTCEVINALNLENASAQNIAHFVAIVRESIDFESHAEINPNVITEGTQLEEWSWVLFVKGGGGALDDSAKGAQVDTTLETVRTALNAQRLTSDCGPLNIESEEYINGHGTGVMYAQRWRHSRLAD